MTLLTRMAPLPRSLAVTAALLLAIAFTSLLVPWTHAQTADSALAPSNLTAELLDSQVNLSWDAPAEDTGSVTGYEILRRPLNGKDTLGILVADTSNINTAFTDQTAHEPGVRFTYRVKALRGDVKSLESNHAYVDIPESTTQSAGSRGGSITTLDEPRNLELTPVAVGTNGVGIKVSWDVPSATGGSDISGYRIQWKGSNQDYPDDQETRQAFVENGPYTIDTTSPTPIEGDELTVRVAAVNGAGAGVWTEKIGWLPSHTDLELWLLMKEYADEKQTTFPGCLRPGTTWTGTKCRWK